MTNALGKIPTTLGHFKQFAAGRGAGTARKYLYGVINCGSLRSLELIGMSGAVVYCQPYKSIGAAVSDVYREECLQDISAVAHHETVIESLMEQFSLLPARFGTILSGPEQLHELLHENHASFCRDLQRLENKVEFDLKVLWPACEIRMSIGQNEASLESFERLRKTDTPGARYALYKRRERVIQDMLQRKAAQHADEIHGSLLPICSETRCQIVPSEGIMLRGAYLIERGRCNEMHRAVEMLQSNTTRFSFLLSGPWPPYSFMNLEERILKCEVV